MCRLMMMKVKQDNSLPVSQFQMTRQGLGILRDKGTSVNSLAPRRSECDYKNRIFNLFLLVGIIRFSQDNALRWIPQDLTDDKSTLVQVMAWCHQATSHYLNQCWLSPLSPYSVARPQWLNSSPLDKMAAILADDIFKCIFLNENDKIQIRMSLKLVPWSPIDNKPALV